MKNANNPGAIAEDNRNNPTRGESKGYVLVALIYLLGLVMGARYEYRQPHPYGYPKPNGCQ